MTFDDGILKLYQVENIAAAGMKPKNGLVYMASHYFGFETVGYSRYYTALQAKNQITNLVHVWEDRSIMPDQVCVLEDGLQYKVSFVQHAKNDQGLAFTRLTLERLGEAYEFKEDIPGS